MTPDQVHAGVLAGLFTATGQVIYGSVGTAAATLAIGTAFQTLNVSAGATAPQWMASLQSLLATGGSMIGASAANTPAHIPKGTAFQELVMNSSANGQTWASGVVAAAVTAGYTFFSTGANSVTGLAPGTARQAFVMNPGATGVTWATSLQSLITTAGQIVYGSAANTPAVLTPPGTASQFLTISATGVPSWVAGENIRNVATSAVGSSANPTFTSTTYVDLTDMTCTLTTSGGDIVCWFSGSFSHSTFGNDTLAFSLDGAAEVGDILVTEMVAGFAYNHVLVYRFAAPSSASHTIKVRVKTNVATLTATGTQRYMTVQET